MVSRTVDLVGIDHVAIGTDRSHNHTIADLHWMRMGRWTKEIDYGAGSADRSGLTPPADWLQDVSSLGDIPRGLEAAGFDEGEARNILSGNWIRLYRTVFGE